MLALYSKKIGKFLIGTVGVVWLELKICYKKIMRRFDSSDEHAKDMRCHLANISQRVDAYLFSFNHHDL